MSGGMATSVSIQPASLLDAEDIARVKLAAFKDETLHRAIFGTSADPEDERYAELLQWQTAVFAHFLGQPGDHFFKAVDVTNGRTVGFTSWVIPEHKTTTDANASDDGGVKHPETEGDDELDMPGAPLPLTGIDKALLLRVEVEENKTKEQMLGERANDISTLGILAVLPDYQRQGIAQKLMDAGMSLVDAAAKAAYLEAWPMGAKLYLRNGFTFLSGKTELVDGYVMRAMLREAKGTNENSHERSTNAA